MAETTNLSRSQPCDPSRDTSVRTGLSVADLKQSFLDNLLCAFGRVPMAATRHDLYAALAEVAR